MVKSGVNKLSNLKTKKIKISFGIIIAKIYILIFIIIILFPLIWMFSISFRPAGKLYESYFYIIPKYYTLNNYMEAFKITEIKQSNVDFANTFAPLYKMFLNSVVITVTAVTLSVLISAIAAYSFSKLKFKGRKTIFLIILLCMMIPTQSVIIPVFLLSKNLGLLNNLLSVILAYTAFGLPLPIFILRGFFNNIPIELSEVAKIDGASEMRILFSIFFPIARPAFATCIIFNSIYFWNELLFGMVLLQKKELYTIPVALSKFVQANLYFPINLFSALIFLTCIPIIIVYLFLQKWFIKGLTAGAIKG